VSETFNKLLKSITLNTTNKLRWGTEVIKYPTKLSLSPLKSMLKICSAF